MTAYTFPGVYVNEVPAPVSISAGNIPGEAVAAFAANYNVGPTVPTFITSWQGFQQLFGGFKSGSTSYLPYAVYQYFANGGTGCYVLRVPNSDATQAALTIAQVAGGGDILAPIAPTVGTATSGGTILAGTYQVLVTYVNAQGETLASPATPQTTTGSTSTITITSPIAETGAVSWYAYVSQAGGSAANATRQQALGSPTLIGTNLVITAPPTNTGALQPIEDTAGLHAQSMTVTALYPGAWGSTLYVTVTPANGSATSLFTLQVYQGGNGAANLVESWPSISLAPTSPRYAPNMINSTTGGSAYIRLSGYPSVATYVSGTTDPYALTTPVALGTTTGPGQPGIIGSIAGVDGSTPIDLYGAVSGTASPSVSWRQGSFATVLGQQILTLNLPDSSGVQGANPTINYTLINNVLTWGAGVGNLYMVIDGQFNGGIASSAAVTAALTTMTQGSLGSSVLANVNAAIYGPWLSITDPAVGTTGATRWVPPGGAILGTWAVSDNQFNVAQTPAGVQATVTAVGLEAYFSPTDLGNLEAAQVNPIRVIPAAGFCLFGGLTTAPGYPNKYININRALMKIQHDLQYITAFAVFQNNDDVLWAQISAAITNYLVSEMQDGLLAGTTPATAFQVVCDSTVNTPNTIAAGMVNATVAVALAAPAEFVVINLTQMASGSTATISS
jgi:uncharacterized protein